MVRRGEEMTEREWAIPSRPLRVLAMAILALVVPVLPSLPSCNCRDRIPDLEGTDIGIAFLALSTVGSLIVIRRGNPVGWLLLLDGLFVWLSVAGVMWATTGRPGAVIGRWFSSGVGTPDWP